MRILDENNIELIEGQINLELGYLRPESIISIHHEAIEETKRRRNIQEKYNKEHGINVIEDTALVQRL